jgi:4-hydroxy-tetrahydrodipicolinate reductase
MKIALIGYGKMGKELEKAALSRGHEIVCIIDVDNQEDFESEAFKSADVAIEFTNPMVAYNNYMKAFKADVKLVSGSTGWLEEHGEEVRKLCSEGGKTLFWSSNFSLGVAIFSAVNKYLAKIMNRFPAYDVTMSETHHIHKLDAPSGTAITLAEGILDNLDRKSRWVKGTLQAPDGTVSGSVECAANELPVEIIQNTFGQGNGSAAWSIQLVYMVSFAHCYVVSREPVHDLRQIFVDGREYGYSQTEIR